MNLKINPDRKTARRKRIIVVTIYIRRKIDDEAYSGIETSYDGGVSSPVETVLVSTLVALIYRFSIRRSIPPTIQTRHVNKFHRPATPARRNQTSCTPSVRTLGKTTILSTSETDPTSLVRVLMRCVDIFWFRFGIYMMKRALFILGKGGVFRDIAPWDAMGLV
jgi:hypothetical protein